MNKILNLTGIAITPAMLNVGVFDLPKEDFTKFENLVYGNGSDPSVYLALQMVRSQHPALNKVLIKQNVFMMSKIEKEVVNVMLELGVTWQPFSEDDSMLVFLLA